MLGAAVKTHFYGCSDVGAIAAGASMTAAGATATEWVAYDGNREDGKGGIKEIRSWCIQYLKVLGTEWRKTLDLT